MRRISLALLVLAGCDMEGLQGATADTLTGAAPFPALAWGLPALVLGAIAGLHARPDRLTPARQTRTGTFTILALIFAGICARAMLGPRWQLGYGLLFGATAIAALACARWWTPAARPRALAAGLGFLLGVLAIALALPTWTAATPYLALAAATAGGAIGIGISGRRRPGPDR